MTTQQDGVDELLDRGKRKLAERDVDSAYKLFRRAYELGRDSSHPESQILEVQLYLRIAEAARAHLQSQVPEGKHVGFEFPGAHTAIFRIHEPARDNWPGCRIRFTDPFRATMRRGEDTVGVIDSGIIGKNVSVDEYPPSRFNDWQPDTESCKCPECRSDHPFKLQIHILNIMNSGEERDDEGWIEALSEIIPKNCGFHLYARTFGGKYWQTTVRILFVLVRNEDLQSFDLNRLKEKVTETFGEQGSREWSCRERNVDPSFPVAQFDRYGKVYIGGRGINSGSSTPNHGNRSDRLDSGRFRAFLSRFWRFSE